MEAGALGAASRRQAPQNQATAARYATNRSPGNALSNSHVIAIGRSASWLTYLANPAQKYGIVRPVPSDLLSRTNSSTRVPRCSWFRYRCPVSLATDVDAWLSQWNSRSLIA